MSPIAPTLGLLRSLAIYYGHPLRHGRLVRLYQDFIQAGDLVFDVGAHVGNHTRAFLALGARVIAFEPQPIFARFLQQSLGRQPDVTLLSSALAAGRGKARMHISSRAPTVSTMNGDWKNRVSGEASFRGVRWDKEMDVETTTLDRCIARFGIPKLVKLDVEGSELEILSGLSAPVPVLVFEALPAALPAALRCLDRLSELGFDRFNWTGGERARLHSDWVSAVDVRRLLETLPGDARELNIFARSDGI